MADTGLDGYQEIKDRHMGGNGGADASPATLGECDAGLDDYRIPPRGWLLGNAFCRRFLSALLGDGGVGKTALRIAQLLSLATGRSLTGEHVFRRARVLLLSLEDDADELRRRIRAAMLHHGVEPVEIKGWLYRATPRGLSLAEMKDGALRIGDLEAALRRTIIARKIDVVAIDPFIKAHRVEENDNRAVDFVCGILANIAAEYDCAVDAPHHVSKTGAAPGDANRGRGASAFKDAARLVYTLAAMTSQEAVDFGVSEVDRRSLIRLDSAKVNIVPPAAQARWFRLVGVPLGNATPDYPNGDEVQTVEVWIPPDTWAGLSHHLLNEVLTAIDKGLPEGGRYSDHSAAKDRAAWKVVQRYAPSKTEAQAREIIGTWVKTGVLTVEQYNDPTRRQSVKGLKVNDAKRPS
jgi:hypothetical protein